MVETRPACILQILQFDEIPMNRMREKCFRLTTKRLHSNYRSRRLPLANKARAVSRPSTVYCYHRLRYRHGNSHSAREIEY